MKIIYESFPENQFIKEETKKECIVLHHTVSSNATSPIEWWKQTPERVATAFVIAKDGTIHQLYDPKYFAYHIGKGSNTVDNKRTIGIEIVNEGLLTKTADGSRAPGEPTERYLWNDGKSTFKGDVYKHPTLWRGSYYFAMYKNEQYQALGDLILKLTNEFNIERRLLMDFKYDKSYFQYKGILSHHNLRADKSDVSVAFDFQKLIKCIKYGKGLL